MRNQSSFEDHAIIACETLIPELDHLKKSGFLNARKILFTRPGRYEKPGSWKMNLYK